ncbi:MULTISPECIES: serine hydrolase domain-containing protein [Saccharibacillus]|uniref:serine hydrolase domain-containing protein n=1 Tax=Saccharibacillus TaxID=456492 RepID=UPI00123A0D30|nr:serine hydrolase domain-containing protein [Saccharibacillus sp. WB 17]MWJ32052.1 serine hydrolase [Saccharibacillus sp. WB 17]
MDAITDMLQNNKKIARWSALPEHAPAIGWIVRGEKFYWTPESGAAGQAGTSKPKSKAKKAPEPQYEIGSITKTMTAFRLAQGEQDGLWQPSDTLAQLIPELESSDFARQVTLRQLATHTSGLTRLAKNQVIASMKKDKSNPYAPYTEEQLLEAVLEEKFRSGAKHEYSNYGYGLLGWALGRISGVPLHESLRRELFVPIGMSGTEMPVLDAAPAESTAQAGGAAVSKAAAGRGAAPAGTVLVPGFAPGGRAVPHWDFTSAMAGAGAVRSTVPDMLTYLEAQLGQHPAAAPFESSLLACQNEQASVAPSKGVGIGYAWMRSMRKDGTVTHWHNGATYGASSFAAFNRDLQSGFVILSNRGVSFAGQLKQMVGLGELSTDRAAHLVAEALFKNE